MIAPLTARVEPWMSDLCAHPEPMAEWLREHGSPLNIIDPRPMARNAGGLAQAATNLDVQLEIFFARKANKALALVSEARRLGLGVDVASERELQQTLDHDVPPERIVVTAAIKPDGLLALCVAHGVTVVIDNQDELHRLLAIAGGQVPPIDLRLAPAVQRLQTRFGFGFDEALEAAAQVTVGGVHFHLDGYDAADRVSAIRESIDLVDALRQRGHDPRHIDIGGGIPISYLDSQSQWQRFWDEHHRAPQTYDGHPLGRVYPYHQTLVHGAWLEQVLAPVAQDIGARDLTIRCEPGRSLLDGCGMTAARVQFRKQRGDGTWLIGAEMNRTQCRSGSDDFLVDPLLVHCDEHATTTGPVEGFLVGAYCIERELLTWRRLDFPEGVAVGDLIVFPNTAGYLMHLLESSSHQLPLARNLIVSADGPPTIDLIDRVSRAHSLSRN